MQGRDGGECGVQEGCVKVSEGNEGIFVVDGCCGGREMVSRVRIRKKEKGPYSGGIDEREEKIRRWIPRGRSLTDG